MLFDTLKMKNAIRYAPMSIGSYVPFIILNNWSISLLTAPMSENPTQVFKPDVGQ
jgi:phospholipase C